MSKLNEALREFDATEANLKRLRDLWDRIKELIPSGLAIEAGSDTSALYDELTRRFDHIRKSMPWVNGIGIENRIVDLDGIFQCRFDAKEVGEIGAEIDVERAIYAQGGVLDEYGFQLAAERRKLVREALKERIAHVDKAIGRLATQIPDEESTRVDNEDWRLLKELISEIEVLRGSVIPAPNGWADLSRHLHFGLGCDLRDIVEHDWPSVRNGLEDNMYGPEDAIPVKSKDLGELVKNAPTGPVVTGLDWSSIDENAFERLIFNLVSDANGYTNPQWLTRTKAPDRGRDVSATRTVEDPLSGTRVYRVIIQCKHWHENSIGVDEVAKLIAQMALWEPPKVDELVIATSGRFSTDAVDWIEKHNNDRKPPHVTMWAESHLETLLASRPHLTAEFGLR